MAEMLRVFAESVLRGCGCAGCAWVGSATWGGSGLCACGENGSWADCFGCEQVCIGEAEDVDGFSFAEEPGWAARLFLAG